MLRRWWLGALVVFSLAAFCRAESGTVKTVQGETFTGEITRNRDGSVTVISHGIATQIDPTDVAVVLPATSIDEEFHNREARLDPRDVSGRIDLANWASQNDRPDLAVTVLQQALQISPGNRQAAVALNIANRQVELNEAAHHSRAAGIATTRSATTQRSTATTAEAEQSGPHQVLTDEDINTLRQKELPADDESVRIVLRGDVMRRYLAHGDHDVAAFRQLPLSQQARQILASGDPDLLPDVRVLNDPPSLRIFRQQIDPIIETACGTVGCHGGTGGGDFHLYSNDIPNAAYTNFYILQTYSTLIGGVPRPTVDRTLPEQSLILQFGLAASEASMPHPAVPNFRPRFRVRSDGGYQHVLEWIADDLNPVLPDYGLAVSPYFGQPPQATTKPATRPATQP